MKNKNAEQREKKQKHKDLLKKTRRKEPVIERKGPELTEKPTILIVCEGENTEPSYFRQFRLSTATIKPIGEGYNTLSLVKRAIELSNKKEYDQVWCVFDKDSFASHNFNQAIILAETNKFGVAYSNQAFEYWILLHFDDHQGGAMNRGDYDTRLNELLKPLGAQYNNDQSKFITKDIFELLEGKCEKTGQKRIDLAIKRAIRIYDLLDHTNPANEESSTTVFRLVKELNKYR